MKLTRAIRIGAPSNEPLAKAICGRLSSSSGDFEVERRGEIARAWARSASGSPIAPSYRERRRDADRTGPAAKARGGSRTASVWPEEQETRKRSSARRSVTPSSRRAALCQQEAVADLARLQRREAIVAVEVGQPRGVGADDLDLAERRAVEERDRIASARRPRAGSRGRARPVRTRRASASRRIRASARRRPGARVRAEGALAD